VASTAAQLHAIALTAIQETLRRKVLYVVLILTVIVGLVTGSSMAVIQMATESGEAALGDAVRARLATTALSLWSAAATFLAVFLGAVGLSSETTARTIVNVLCRPVTRTTYLTGRWMGILGFLWGFQVVGIVIGLGLAVGLGARFAPTLWLGLAGMLVNAALMSGVSLGLSVVLPPVLAGAVAFLLPVLPVIASLMVNNPWWVVRAPMLAIYYLSPAVMPADLVGDSFTKELMHPQYGLYARVLAENLCYAVAVFTLACAVFERRELTLR